MAEQGSVTPAQPMAGVTSRRTLSVCEPPVRSIRSPASCQMVRKLASVKPSKGFRSEFKEQSATGPAQL